MVQPVAVTTAFTLEGYPIRAYKGFVRGIVVRSPTLVQGFFGGFKSIVGGRIAAYTEMGETARRQASDQMIAHARQVSANAIVGTRYEGSGVQGGSAAATKVLSHGIAVLVERLAAAVQASRP